MPAKKNHRKTASTNKGPANGGNTPLSPMPNNGTGAAATLGVSPAKHAPPKSPKPAAAVPVPTGPALDYKEIQRNEVEVLQSIWMDDYQPVVKTGAWNVSLLNTWNNNLIRKEIVSI